MLSTSMLQINRRALLCCRGKLIELFAFNSNFSVLGEGSLRRVTAAKLRAQTGWVNKLAAVCAQRSEGDVALKFSSSFFRAFEKINFSFFLVEFPRGS
jgi:hypothetical protein